MGTLPVGTLPEHRTNLVCLLWKHKLNVEETMKLQIPDSWVSLKVAAEASTVKDEDQN